MIHHPDFGLIRDSSPDGRLLKLVHSLIYTLRWLVCVYRIKSVVKPGLLSQENRNHVGKSNFRQ